MGESELIKWLVQVGGPMGFAMGVLVFFYRKDMREMTEQWRGQSTALMDVVKDNTKAMTQVVSAVQSLNEHIRDGERRQ